MICHSEEIWKDIKGYEGIYQASSFGRIRTVEGKTTYTQRHGTRHWKSRILKGRGNNPITGARVNLWKNGKSKEYLVARIVATTFLGEPPKDFTVNHKDGNRFNNNIENLEWLSLADNIRHGFETGLYPQKSVLIKTTNEGTKIKFNSMTKVDVFLGRHKGYTSGRLKKNCYLRDINGTLYEAIQI